MTGPLLGIPLRYGLAETLYYAEPNLRERLGKAIAAERALRGTNPELVTFWTTPYNGGQGGDGDSIMMSIWGHNLGGILKLLLL